MALGEPVRRSAGEPHNGPVTTLARVNRLILPVGLIVVVTAGLVAPAVGESVGAARFGGASFSDVCIITVFFVNGLQTRLTGARDPALLRAIAPVAGINLLLAPVLGVVAVRLLDLPFGLEVGIALMASVPTTLSSAAVIAINVGGDRLWALTLTIVTVLLGSVTAPIAVSWILSADVELDPWPVLLTVAATVILPTVLGYLLRKFLWHSPPQWVSVVPSVAVLGVVWVTMSTNAEAAKAMAPVLVLAMIAAASVGHGALLAAARAASAGMPVRHAMPVLFVASQKTLPLALTILAIISEQLPEIAAVAAVATITCLVWHFLQLFADSVLAHRLALRHAAALPTDAR